MSEATHRRQSLLTERASAGGRSVSRMQIAAQILEDCADRHAGALDGAVIGRMDATGIRNQIYIT